MIPVELHNSYLARPSIQFSYPLRDRQSHLLFQRNPLQLPPASNYDLHDQHPPHPNLPRYQNPTLYFPAKEPTYYLSKLLRNQGNHDSAVFKHFISSWKIMKQYQNLLLSDYFTQVNMPQRQQHRNKKTLIFDLDETLIHSTKSQDTVCDLRIPMYFPNGEFINAGVNVRPYALDILQRLSKHFEIVIFTASHSYYADPILNALDPENRLFQYRLYREHCTEISKHTYVKDLRIIPRDMKKMVLIDNSPITYLPQLANGIPILSYYQGKDRELKDLEQYLMKLRDVEDVRGLNNATFNLPSYSWFQTPQQLLQELYLQQE